MLLSAACLSACYDLDKQAIDDISVGEKCFNLFRVQSGAVNPPLLELYLLPDCDRLQGLQKIFRLIGSDNDGRLDRLSDGDVLLTTYWQKESRVKQHFVFRTSCLPPTAIEVRADDKQSVAFDSTGTSLLSASLYKLGQRNDGQLLRVFWRCRWSIEQGKAEAGQFDTYSDIFFINAQTCRIVAVSDGRVVTLTQWNGENDSEVFEIVPSDTIGRFINISLISKAENIESGN